MARKVMDVVRYPAFQSHEAQLQELRHENEELKRENQGIKEEAKKLEADLEAQIAAQRKIQEDHARALTEKEEVIQKQARELEEKTLSLAEALELNENLKGELGALRQALESKS
jgi:predicted RNase H-like nuclease (RuvC/YqgF family)